ncbi:Probable microtubule-binding protein TANGLED [Striga hermonthica]|uniref:Probable microtubule-binding protein TANGLED n=1 Tax=Striga hermonthica TaxID=68872 RepID=A0A9N7MN49_STRHE|nr:Probable microtubule-binding protein TANGLED [Striga hermonthica]
MVARTPPKQPRKKMAAIAPHLSPTLLRETVRKVDKCMSRLQELQHTVTGGSKAISSPLRSSYRTNVPAFKQDLSRIRNANNPQRSPPGKLPPVKTEDWRRMSLPAMLLGETMSELVQATQFAKNIVQTATRPSKIRKSSDDPKTPPLEKKKAMRNTNLDDTWQKMHARRKREKKMQTVVWSGPGGTSPRAKSKINFKECDKENCSSYVIAANRVSPKNRPWARKTVLFPNPLFHSSLLSSPTREKVPVIGRSVRQTPHKFLIKSPPLKSPKRLANKIMIISPLKGRKNEENMAVMKEIEKSRQIAHKFLMQGKTKNESAAGLGKKLSPPPAKLRRSFSPSRLAKRIVLSPMKFRSSMQKNERSTNI